MDDPLKCDVCGQFIPLHDLLLGAARHYMVTPDSDLSSEEWETLCKRCNDRLKAKAKEIKQ